MTFEGWVPNASGNLSFGNTGKTLGRGSPKFQHLRIEHRRWIAVSQTRRNQDPLVPFFSSLGAPKSARRSTRSVPFYIMLAKSLATTNDAEGKLVGTVYIAPKSSNGGIELVKDIRVLMKDFKARDESYRKGGNSHETTDEEWRELNLRYLVNSDLAYNFVLLRNGKIFIDIHRDKVGNAPDYLLPQAYYFVKDCMHRHYHHNRKSDGIIELTASSSTPDWRHRTIRSLYRFVIDMRRADKNEDLCKSLGVLSYAATFIDLFNDKDFDEDGNEVSSDVAPLPHYSPGLRESIEVRRDISGREKDWKHIDAQFIVLAVIASIAALIGLVDSLPKNSLSYKLFIWFVNFFAFRPVYYILLITLAIFAYRAYLGKFRGLNNALQGWFYRLLAWMPQKILATLSAFVTIMLLLAAVHIGFPGALNKVLAAAAQITVELISVISKK